MLFSVLRSLKNRLLTDLGGLFHGIASFLDHLSMFFFAICQVFQHEIGGDSSSISPHIETVQATTREREKKQTNEKQTKIRTGNTEREQGGRHDETAKQRSDDRGNNKTTTRRHNERRNDETAKQRNDERGNNKTTTQRHNERRNDETVKQRSDERGTKQRRNCKTTKRRTRKRQNNDTTTQRTTKRRNGKTKSTMERSSCGSFHFQLWPHFCHTHKHGAGSPIIPYQSCKEQPHGASACTLSPHIHHGCKMQPYPSKTYEYVLPCPRSPL